MTEPRPASTELSRTNRILSALSHTQLGLTTIIALGVTMVFALLAGGVEALYLLRQDKVSFVEQYALVFVGIGLCVTLFILMKFPGEFIDVLALLVFVIAVIYIFAMLTSALFLSGDIPRSLHAVLWFHPAFIAVTLTQPMKIAQIACWLVILFLGGVIVYFDAIYDGDLLTSTALVNHWIIFLSLCASSALLYSLSIFREKQGASAARIEVLEEYSAALQAEAEAKEKLNGELAQANAVVASFLDNMSHELRTPLNAIIGFSELIHGEMFGTLANNKYKEYAGDILGSGQSLLEMVNNLLYFSKLSAGKISLNTDSLDAMDIITQIAGTQRARAESTQISIVTDVAGQPVLQADPHALTRILNGLLNNAIKFSNAGGTVFMQAMQRGDGACEISVRDTGAGIAEAEQEKILVPFRKGADSEKQAMPGVGLGLATAKLLMDLQDGTMRIDSKPGAGTCVTLVFYEHPHSSALANAG
jgi:signal transduction histidine kinase